MTLNQIKKIIAYLIIVIIIVISIIFLFKLAPGFLLSVCISFLLQCFIKQIEIKFGYSKFKRFLLTIIIFILFFAFIFLSVYLIILSLKQSVLTMEIFKNDIKQIFNYSSFLKEHEVLVNWLLTNLSYKVDTIIIEITQFLFSVIKRLPAILYESFFFMLFTFIITIDYYNIKKIIFKYNKFDNEKFIVFVETIKNTFLCLLRVNLITCFYVFICLILGLYIIGVDNFILNAIVITIVDMLPLIGLEIVFIPWLILVFIKGELSIALFIVLLYILIKLIKQFIETKIMIDLIKVHPLLFLLCAYIGYNCFGFFGMFGCLFVLMCYVEYSTITRS